MMFQILKKDLLKRKGVNAILFLFITLATIFLASSVNNIMVVTSAVEYYMDFAAVPDVTMILTSDDEKPKIETYLDQEKQKGAIDRYTFSEMVKVPDKGVHINKDGETVDFDANNASMFIGTLDEENKVFDKDGNSFTLKNGEIALSSSSMDNNNLEVGDRIIVKFQNQTKEFTIAMSQKDCAFGSDMVGMLRFIVNEEDLISLRNQENVFGMYNITCGDEIDVKQNINNQSFTTVMNVVNRGMYQLIYSFDMIFAALLILIGVCLILIALLVLRFTLIFTMEEQYQEIGILKAIGLRDFVIKKIYLMKYFVLVLSGSLIGLASSFPVSNMMVKSVSENMIMESSNANYIVNILCAAIVVLFVMIFCYLCTKKLSKVSAITAIHGGNEGERFHKQRGLSLAKRKYMPVVLYLGVNDILTHLRRYAVLIVTFCISFILITIPLNTLNTMKSEEMISKFILNPESSVYVNAIESKDESQYTDLIQLEKGMSRVKAELKEKGYDAKLTAGLLYFLSFSKQNETNKQNLLTIYLFGDETNYLQYSEGSAPVLANEVAFSKQVLKDNDWEIGDYVYVNLAQEERKLLITGSYSDYMQIGQSARLSPSFDCSNETMFEYSLINVDFATEMTQEDAKITMQNLFPQYEWKTAREFINQNIGGIQDILQEILLPMTLMLCGVIMLIALLMERLFITREKGEIAMMKSMGFPQHTIALWQIARMSCVVLLSMIISVPLSLLSNQFLLKPIFAIMGAEVVIQVNGMEAYIIYPCILLIGIILATWLPTLSLRYINIREMNNLE